MLLSLATLTLPSLEKPFTTQAPLHLIEVSKGARKTINQGQGLRWPRVRRPSKRVLSPRIRVRVKRSDLRPRPRTPRMLSQSWMWSPRPRKPSPNPKQTTLRRTLPCQGIFIGALYFTSLYPFFFLLWQFTTIYNVPSF